MVCGDSSLGPAVPDPHTGQRIVVLGDSVAIGWPARVPTVMMGLLENGAVTAFTGNAGVPNAVPIKFTPEQSDYWSVRAQEPMGYAIEQDVGLGTVFTLPVGRIVELVAGPSEAGSSVGEFQFRTGWWSGWGREFPQSGNSLAARLHTRRPTAGDQEFNLGASNIFDADLPSLPPISPVGQISSPFQGIALHKSWRLLSGFVRVIGGTFK